MDENKGILFQKTKRVTFLLGILTMLTSIMYVAGSMFAVMQLYYMEEGLSLRIIGEFLASGMGLVFVFALFHTIFCVTMFIFNLKLRKEKIVSKVPYIIFLAFQITNTIAEIMTSGLTINSVIILGILMLLPTLAIINLRKLEPLMENAW